MALYELIYVSFAVRPMGTAELTDMLDEFRVFNGAHGITGLLVYHRQEFMQLLEGEWGEVQALFDRIRRDDRHQQVHTLWEGALDARAFDGWSMAFFAPEPHDLLDHPGYGDLLAAGLVSQTQHPTRGRRLLMALREEFLPGG